MTDPSSPKLGRIEVYHCIVLHTSFTCYIALFPIDDQMQTTVMQPGHSTVRNSTSRNPPVPGTMSQAQLAQQQQRNSPQLTDPAQLFQLLPSGKEAHTTRSSVCLWTSIYCSVYTYHVVAALHVHIYCMHILFIFTYLYWCRIARDSK